MRVVVVWRVGVPGGCVEGGCAWFYFSRCVWKVEMNLTRSSVPSTRISLFLFFSIHHSPIHLPSTQCPSPCLQSQLASYINTISFRLLKITHIGQKGSVAGIPGR